MSDYFPFDLQVEIIKRLPVKSLIQFRSVSKPWKAFIDSHEFIAGYGVHFNQLRRLILRYEVTKKMEKYITFTDDHNFPRHKFSPILPDLVKKLVCSEVVGSSHGLVCLYGAYRDTDYYMFMTPMAILWNPSIRKSIGVVLPYVLRRSLYETAFGFGVCPETNDPIIVKISYVRMDREQELKASLRPPWVVNVFTLSSGKWRRCRRNLPHEWIKVAKYRCDQTVIGKFIYWFGYDRVISSEGEFEAYNLIISFDMTNKEFRVVDLPDNLSNRRHKTMSISKVHGSLAVLECGWSYKIKRRVCDVWVMEDGFRNSFTKLLTINLPYAITRILTFRNNDQPILEATNDFKEPSSFVVYEPSLKEFLDLEIHGEECSFSLSPYVETLLLLNQLDGRIYPDIKVRDYGMCLSRRVKKRRA